MAKIIIDGQEYEVEAGKNLLQAALEAGLDIPYFCWHPALGSVGACRQCAVKQYRDENDERGMIMMSCMVPCGDGNRFSIEDEEISEFRKTVTEWLMTNHPHDCPVCDEGGECHLQDMTVMTGHNYRNYRFAKRTYINQDLGPHINHEMNRCITCYRCVRFYDDYAGGKDLQAIGSHNHIYFGRHEDGTLENEFSGNLVEVCPTGVFTDKTFKQHYLRKWDLQTAPSICQGCGVGCNIIPGERFGQLKRILNRYHGDLNGYFLCDRGRFGYEYVNSDNRIRIPAAQDNGEWTDLDEAGLSEKLESMIGPGKKLIGIGSPRASIESNFALRALVGPENYSTGLNDREARMARKILEIRRSHPVLNPSLKDIEASDAVLILGEDLTHTAPRMALAVRQAVRNQPNESLGPMRIPEWSDKAVRIATFGQSGPLFMATSAATKLDDIATEKWHGGTAEITRIGFAIAHLLNDNSPAVEGLSEKEAAFAQAAAKALGEAVQPVIISGMTLGQEALIEAAANVALALHREERPTRLAYTVPEANTLGVALLEGIPLEEALSRAEKEEPEALVVVENDLYQRLPATVLDAILCNRFPILAIDHSKTRTTASAHLVLPSGPFAEADGTLINFEGRAQRFFQVYPAPGAVQEAWRWIRDLLAFGDSSLTRAWENLDDLLMAIAAELPALSGIVEAAPLATFRANGSKFGRLSRRASGRTAIQAHVEVSEDKPEEDPDSSLTYSMEGSATTPPPGLMNRFWAPGWNSVSSLNKFQDEIGGSLHGGDPGVLLLQKESGSSAAYYSSTNGQLSRPADELQFLPTPHIFGSEEWSSQCEGIRRRGPGPHVLLNKSDAQAAGLSEGDLAKIALNGFELTLPVQYSESLSSGTAGLTPGLPGLEGLPLPANGKLLS